MKYYVLAVKTYLDGKADKKSFDTYETAKEAVAAANKEFGSFIGASNIKSIMVKSYDSAGNEVEKTMFWKAEDIDIQFYTSVITTFNDGSADTSKLYTASTIEEALSTAHTQYGGKLELANLQSVLSKVVNSCGGDHVNLYWNEPTEEPEPETTTEG